MMNPMNPMNPMESTPSMMGATWLRRRVNRTRPRKRGLAQAVRTDPVTSCHPSSERCDPTASRNSSSSAHESMDRCARLAAPSTSRLQPSPSPRRRPRGGSRSPNHGASSFGTSSHQLKTSERMNLSHSPTLAHSQPQDLTTRGQTVTVRSPTTYIYTLFCARTSMRTRGRAV